MAAEACWESFKAEGSNVMARIKELLHKGNVRRVVVEHAGKTVAEFPLTAGVIGVLAAPVLAAVAALVALLKDCTIKVEVSPAEGVANGAPAEHAPVDVQC